MTLLKEHCYASSLPVALVMYLSIKGSCQKGHSFKNT